MSVSTSPDEDRPIGVRDSLPPESIIFGQSASMRALRNRVEFLAAANLPVLICGESGTGKEVLARFIHLRSPFGGGPFVKVSCPAIPGPLLESELFGYERGAFTGAIGSKPGRVETAHRGTLFLDEISEFDMALQAKLLHLLQDGQFARIGSQGDRRVEVRVVCSSNRHLEESIEAGTFRRDLFYRINVVNLRLPPLRERPQDIPLLVGYLLKVHNQQFGGHAAPLSRRLMRFMEGYEWPGNIRELENAIKRYVVLGSDEAISNELLSHGPRYRIPEFPADGPVSLKKVTRQAVQELERRIIFRALQANRWNRRQAARELKISYRALLYKLRQAKISPAKVEASRVEGGSG
jgi:two-component system, NtrC family, response regulator AtoC